MKGPEVGFTVGLVPEGVTSTALMKQGMEVAPSAMRTPKPQLSPPPTAMDPHWFGQDLMVSKLVNKTTRK